MKEHGKIKAAGRYKEEVWNTTETLSLCSTVSRGSVDHRILLTADISEQNVKQELSDVLPVAGTVKLRFGPTT